MVNGPRSVLVNKYGIPKKRDSCRDPTNGVREIWGGNESREWVYHHGSDMNDFLIWVSDIRHVSSF